MYWLFQISGSQPAGRMKGHRVSHVTVLLASLLTVATSKSSGIIFYNVSSMDCGRADVWHCVRDLRQLARQGFPWLPPDRQKMPRKDQNVTDNLRDALDALNHMCYIQDRSESCLQQQHDVSDFCLSFAVGSHRPEVDFQFICHHRRRDENLVRSLQCLYNERLLATLGFHIANRCGGFSVLDNIMRGRKKEYMIRMSVNPITDAITHPLPLNCLPKDILNCIKQLIDDHCGAMTADLVHQYILYIQERVRQAFASAGVCPYMCQSNIDCTPSTPQIPQLHGKLEGKRNMSASGTALDTIYGYSVRTIWTQPPLWQKTCATPQQLYFQYYICVMSSDVKSEMPKFNILQFAHGMIPIPYHGSHCDRLELFTECWKLLQETCGPKVRGLEQHATLLVEGCKIQSEMDAARCHWQDMLLRHYIQASQVTIWPLGGQGMHNPMWLDNMHYNTSVVREDLDKVISLLKPGVEDISRICSQQLGRRVKVLLDKIRYLQLSAFKYAGLLPNRVGFTP